MTGNCFDPKLLEQSEGCSHAMSAMAITFGAVKPRPVPHVNNFISITYVR